MVNKNHLIVQVRKTTQTHALSLEMIQWDRTQEFINKNTRTANLTEEEYSL